MRKKPLLAALLCALLMLSACGGDQPTQTTVPPPTESWPINTGPTAPATKTVYVIDSITSIRGDRQTKVQRIFDDQDRVKEMVTYMNGVEVQRQAAECDKDGNYTRLTCESSVIEHTYEAGHLTGTYTYFGNELNISKEYRWENDLLLTITDKIPSQNTEQKLERTFDSQGRIIREDHSLNGSLSSYTVYVYAEDGSAQITTYDTAGSVTQTAQQTWDGSTATTTVYAADGNISTVDTQTYDAQGNLINDKSCDADGTVLTEQIYVWKVIEIPIEQMRSSN